MRELTRQLRISVVAYSPLGRGLLGGTVRSAADVDGRRAAHPRFQPGNLERNRRLIEPLERIAQGKGCTPAQVALAWLLAQGDDVVAIPGIRRMARLDENIAAAGVTLTDDELARLEAAIPTGSAAGDRYPQAGMGAVQI